MTIRRPIYYAAASFTAAVFLTHIYRIFVPVAVLLMMLFLCSSKTKSGRDPEHRSLMITITLCFIAGFILMQYHEMYQDPAEAMEGRTVFISGKVLQSEMKRSSDGSEKRMISVKAYEICSGERSERIRDGLLRPDCRVMVSCREETPGNGGEPVPGNIISARGTITVPAGKRNPGCFDYRLYLKGKGIRTQLRAEILICRAGQKTGPAGRICLFREAFLKRIKTHATDQTAAFVRAVLFGDSGMLDEDVLDSFRKNGTAHILAVSGLHIGLIYSMLMKLKNLLVFLLPQRVRRHQHRMFFFFTACFFLAYMTASGFSPSVVRAVLMVMMHSAAQITGRRYDLQCSAFAVGIISVIMNPWVLFQTGFQMSFLAVLMIGLLTPYVKSVYTGIFMSSAVVQIGLFPYMICHFGIFSPAAVLVNVPAVYLTGILVPAGFFAMVTPVFRHQADILLAGLSEVLIRFNDICCIEGITSFQAASPPPFIETLWYIGLAAFASEEGRRLIIRRDFIKLKRRLALVILAACIVGAGCDDGFRSMDVVFVDVGQGDCVHIRTCGRNYLIDGGGSSRYHVGKKTVRPYLLANGVSAVDGAFVTHLHTDHYKGICELAKEGMVRRLYVYDANRLKQDSICRETGLTPEKITYIRRGHKVRLSREASLTVLWPEKKQRQDYQKMISDEENENASSLIMKVMIRGITLIDTGDMDEEGERKLMSCTGDLSADILKAGHHGSRTSNSDPFLNAVSPDLCVIQVGENNIYGHPSPETLRRLRERGIPVLRNDRQGAAGIRVRDGEIRAVRTVVH